MMNSETYVVIQLGNRDHDQEVELSESSGLALTISAIPRYKATLFNHSPTSMAITHITMFGCYWYW